MLSPTPTAGNHYHFVIPRALYESNQTHAIFGDGFSSAQHVDALEGPELGTAARALFLLRGIRHGAASRFA